MGQTIRRMLLGTCLFGAFMVGALEASAAVSLEVLLPDSPADEAKTVVLVASPLESEAEEGDSLRFEVDPGGVVELPVESRSGWRVTAKAVGLWFPEILIPAGADGSYELRGWLASEVLFPITVDGVNLQRPGERGALFGALRLEVSTAPDRLGHRELRAEPVRCELVDDGSTGARERSAAMAAEVKTVVLCPVPTGELDLALRLPGFVPQYFWGTVASAGETVEKKEVVFRPGASLSGRVMLEDGEPAPEGTVVVLTPAVAMHSDDPRVEERLSSRRHEAAVEERGFFQIVGLEPGMVRLEARLQGYAPAVVEPVEIRPDLESQLRDDLVLRRPVALRLTIDPPVDPWGLPWRVEVRREGPDRQDLESLGGAASRDGIWQRDGLAPGRWILSLGGQDGSEWYEQGVQLTTDEDLFVPLSMIEVTGEVVRGGEKLTGTLWMGGRHGVLSIPLELDDEGEFAGWLPRSGHWALTLEGTDGVVDLDPIDVPEGPRSHLKIRIPDTVIRGEVVDEAGEGVAGAVVELNTQRGGEEGAGDSEVRVDRVSVKTKDDGSFEVKGLAPDVWAIVARDASRTSDTTTVDVVEDRRAPELRLVLRALRSVSGRVSSPRGVVSGATVLAWPEMGGTSGVTLAQAVTDPEGRFRVDLGGGSPTAVHLFVQSPGWALHWQRHPVDPSVGGVTEVHLEPEGGTLVVNLAAQAGSARRLVLRHGGSFLPLLALVNFAPAADLGPDGRLVLSGMPAGDYQLCAGGRPAPGEGGGPSCVQGFLPPLGELTLEAPGVGPAR